MITVVIPTYNEAENIPRIIPLIYDVLSREQWETEILVVDDDSPDGTAAIAESLAPQYPVRTILRKTSHGLSQSVIEGFRQAKGDICVVMDADLSHPTEKLPQMIRPILDGEIDLTVGSRYISGGGCPGWPWHRLAASRLGGLLAKGFTRLSDPMSGFMAVRKSILQGLELSPIGWKIVLETVTKTGAQVIEVPILFQDRKYGSSKFDWKIQLLYILHLWHLYDFSWPRFWQFVKFCLVGLSGIAVDTAVLVSCVAGAGLDPRQGAVFAFVAAATWNYLLNARWTFRVEGTKLSSYAGFLLSCALGLCVRIAVMHLLIERFSMGQGNLYVLASLVGIISATGVNFAASKWFVFRNRRAH